MTDLGQPYVYVYTGEGDGTVFTPDTGTGDVPELAQALDATIDALGTALDQGDMGQAQALQTAAETSSDALLDALGLSDADDMIEGMEG